ncbi:hypothetical protein DAPPUDRAFT_260534 [Daphnia pulex]|uniref:DEAD/DEAH-box helicase domain-containing protein n=1 Tax=Daphnia pulex TaxID=6669 RepID=E9HJD6_DAPPU|nr:hypothetical protein DAPPUDRAFT_260534 [Daphnia pulex]|eukprot:EFX68162.1 hypothetical protein DAPPUDRAFT_260534 [Daphnia pulex]
MDLFGFSILKPQQQEVIDAVLADKDCLAVMPNGGGKSACYFIPGLLQNGLTFIVSPLNALIVDHQDKYIEVDVVKEVRDIVGSIWICLNTSFTMTFYKNS